MRMSDWSSDVCSSDLPDTSEPLEQEQRLARQQLRQVVDYAESNECRRAIQLRYFGEVFEGRCGACDNCLEAKVTEDWTLEAQKLLSCVARLDRKSVGEGKRVSVRVALGGGRIIK